MKQSHLLEILMKTTCLKFNSFKELCTFLWVFFSFLTQNNRNDKRSRRPPWTAPRNAYEPSTDTRPRNSTTDPTVCRRARNTWPASPEPSRRRRRDAKSTSFLVAVGRGTRAFSPREQSNVDRRLLGSSTSTVSGQVGVFVGKNKRRCVRDTWFSLYS